MSSIKRDSAALDFPGTSRFVIAQEALDHLERNFATFEKIFDDFNIQKSGYRLLAGFDEDAIRGHFGFLNQIHVFLRSEPKDITSFLSHLSPALGNFSAFIFTDKSTYRLPSSLSDFYDIARHATYNTASKLPSCVSTLSQNTAENTSSTVGGSSGQSSNRGDSSRRKGEMREDSDKSDHADSGKGADGDSDPESPGPGSGDTRSAEVSFRVVTHLHQYGQARGKDAPRSNPFQKLQVQGTVKVKRTSESQDPCRFAICDTEFTELRTKSEPKLGNPTYHHFHLDVRIDAKERHAYITKIRPGSTSKYNPESKVSHVSKKAWNALSSTTVSVVKPQATFGANGSRTGEQSAATEKTARVSRIIQRDIGPAISWSFQITDPFDQETELTLSTEKLSRACFEFRGKTAAPPPESLPLEISTYWSVLSPHGGSAWLTPEGTSSFSNLCKIITLNLSSHLQGLHSYDADFLVWPKHSNMGSTVTGEPENKLAKGAEGLVTTKIVDVDHEIDASGRRIV